MTLSAEGIGPTAMLDRSAAFDETDWHFIRDQDDHPTGC